MAGKQREYLSVFNYKLENFVGTSFYVMYTTLVENLKNLWYSFCDESDHDVNSACDKKKKYYGKAATYTDKTHLIKAYLD